MTSVDMKNIENIGKGSEKKEPVEPVQQGEAVERDERDNQCEVKAVEVKAVEVEAVERDKWDNQCDFFLSCLGYAVGLGNIWRFPYLCYKHGGGSFLLPYGIMLLSAGLPLFFMELSLGQYASVGPARLFPRMNSLLGGLGWGMTAVSFIVSIYYNMIVAWTLYYLYAGMSSSLPWAQCGLTSSAACYTAKQDIACQQAANSTLSTFFNGSCHSPEALCGQHSATVHNSTHCDQGSGAKEILVGLNSLLERKSASEDYFSHHMLGLREDSTWENMGAVQPHLVVCLVLSWLIVGGCLIKGIKSSGKVVYVTAIYPYVILVALLVRGVTLPGSGEGIRWYITPVWSKLAQIQVWADAASQIFYSLGVSFGSLITLASYNRFTNNCHRDALIISFSNCATSVFSGFVIFSIVGFMAHELGVPVEAVVRTGPGLTFVAYPEAIARLPLAPLWSFLFFTMILALGLDSQFAMTETVTTAIMDQWPKARKASKSVVIGSCVAMGVLGIPFCYNSGVFVFELFSWYNSWSLLFLSLLEVVLVSRIYGANKFIENIKDMGIRLGFLTYYWRLTWSYITPVLVAVILTFSLIKFSPCYYESYVYPRYIQLAGWGLSAAPLLPIPAMALVAICRGKAARTKALRPPETSDGGKQEMVELES